MDIKNTKVLAAVLTLTFFTVWGLAIAALNVYFTLYASVVITVEGLFFLAFVFVIFRAFDLSLQIYKYDRRKL